LTCSSVHSTGKSIALQLLKLMVDAGQVQDEMQRYGIDWSGKLPDFLDAYFGEGMHSIWDGDNTSIEWAGKNVDLTQIAKRRRKAKKENLFFIPAQRVLACETAGHDHSPTIVGRSVRRARIQ